MSVSHRRPAPLVASAALILLAVGPAALASSPAAWTQHEQDTKRACAAASDLKDPVVHPKAVLFDDTVGMDARLVTGTWKPAHMKGAKAAMLCLYDRKARKATAQDIEVWRGALPAVAAIAAPAPARAPVKAPAAPTPRAP
ncbi:MAG: hypothetical protein ACK5F5_09575 [Gammaproteobacteria bacterium]|jgi:hypothetical protein